MYTEWYWFKVFNPQSSKCDRKADIPPHSLRLIGANLDSFAKIEIHSVFLFSLLSRLKMECKMWREASSFMATRTQRHKCTFIATDGLITPVVMVIYMTVRASFVAFGGREILHSRQRLLCESIRDVIIVCQKKKRLCFGTFRSYNPLISCINGFHLWI